jgi:hypothetical protein
VRLAVQAGAEPPDRARRTAKFDAERGELRGAFVVEEAHHDWNSIGFFAAIRVI